MGQPSTEDVLGKMGAMGFQLLEYSEDHAGVPSPERPQYDAEGYGVAVSPVSGERRRLNITDPKDLPQWD